MKTHVLIVSRYFPATHKRKGEPTFFVDKVLHRSATVGLDDIERLKPFDIDMFMNCEPKLHTIRANYALWSKRIKEVQEGKAVLSVRYWAGRPYHKDENGIGQVEVFKLDKDSVVGIQKIEFSRTDFHFPIIDGWQGGHINPDNLAKNDGLSLDDFKEWFRKYDLSKTMVIIHFTGFRY